MYLGRMDAGRLHRLSRLLRQIASAATADPDEPPVTAGMLAVMEDIAAHEVSSITEITARTGLAQSAVSRIVATMGAEGLLQVRTDPADRRRTSVRLDPAARTGLLADRASRGVEDALAATLRQAGAPGDPARVLALLDELAAHLIAAD